MKTERETSEICRTCGVLTGGVEAGNRVRWTLCSDCERRRAERRKGKGRRTGRIVNVMRTLPEYDRRAVNLRDRRTTGRREDDA